jgi:hypothetical protein
MLTVYLAKLTIAGFIAHCTELKFSSCARIQGVHMGMSASKGILTPYPLVEHDPYSGVS